MKRAILATLLIGAMLVGQVTQVLPGRIPTAAASTLTQIIEDHTSDKVDITVDGQQYAIVTLDRHINPETLQLSDPPYEPLKVYVDAEGNPVSDESVLLKIIIIDKARRWQQRHMIIHLRERIQHADTMLGSDYFQAKVFCDTWNNTVPRGIARAMSEQAAPDVWDFLLPYGILDLTELEVTEENEDQVLGLLHDPILEVYGTLAIDYYDSTSDYATCVMIEGAGDITDYELAYEYLKHLYLGFSRLGTHWINAWAEITGVDRGWFREWLYWAQFYYEFALNLCTLHAYDLLKGTVLDLFFDFNEQPWVNEYYKGRMEAPARAINWLESDELNRAADYSQRLANQAEEEILVPDLTVSAGGLVVVSPSSVETGNSISVTFTIENIGDAPSGPFSNRVFLSIPPYKWHTDIPLGTFHMASLDAGASRESTVEVPIPQTVPSADYYVTVYTDAFRVVEESENLGLSLPNNIGSTYPQMLSVTEPSRIDLATASISGPSSVELEETISISFTVENLEGRPSGSFTNRVFLSTMPEGTDIGLGEFDMDSLDGSASQTATVDVTIPSSLPSSSYYITVFADGLYTIAETEENNNILSTPIKIAIETPPSPAIASNPSSITFPTVIEGGSDPPSQILSIWNSGGGTLDWSVSSDADWLILEPPSDSCTGEIDNVTVSADISGRSAGSYNATITIEAPGAVNTPQTVTVSLNINPYESLTAPTLYEPSVSGANYTISWSEVSGASSYTLQEDTNSTFPSPIEYRLTQTSKYFEGKSNGTYYYRVAAQSEWGGSPWSETKSVTISSDYPPGDITGIAPQDGATGQLLTVTLQWEASHPGGESLKYNVYVAPHYVDSFFTNHIVAYGQVENNYTVSNLPYNTTVSWGIEAIDETGDTKRSSMFHFTTIADTSTPTGGISINDGAATTDIYSVSLHLSASDAESGVQWMRFSNDGQHWTNWDLYAEYRPWNLADYHYGGETGQTVYTVYVQFKDEQGNISPVYSDTIEKVAGKPGNIILNSAYYETIRDAMEAAGEGDTIYLTEGTYKIYGQTNPPRYPSHAVGIVMKPGVTLMGAGADRTKLVMGSGLWTVIDAEDAVIQGLTIIHEQLGYGRYPVLMESDSSKLKNCVVTGSDNGIMIGSTSSTPSNVEISNNVITVNSGDGINLFAGNNVSILNNTIVHNGINGIVNLYYGEGTVIKNNIVAFNNNYGVYSKIDVDFAHNDVFGSFKNYSTDPGWLQDQTGINGNISSNPLLTGDYTLTSGSPCIDVGTDVGIPYTGGAPDMGAFEYGATGTITVVSNRPDAAFAIEGPQSYSGSGTDWSVSGAPIGVYSITFTPIPGLYSPPYQAKVLMGNETLEFDGIYPEDDVPPEGTISVNFDEYATADNLVTIALSFSDEVAGMGPGAQMKFSNDGVSWSSAEPYSSLKKDWDLTPYGGTGASGTKTIYARVSDAFGNWTANVTDTILYVPDRQILEVPSEQYPTIQAAVDAAQQGDVVHVLPGEYQEEVVLKERIRLQGSGSGVTSINAGGRAIVAADNATIDGFTINEEPWMGYIGISCQDASPIISNNVIRATRGVQILGNSKPIIRNNVVKESSPMAVFIVGEASAVIENNTIVGTTGATGIYVQNATRNTRVYVANNIIANNSVGVKENIGSDPEHQHLFFSFNNYWNNGENLDPDQLYTLTRPGDIDDDPKFNDPANGDFSLQAGSPSINSGHPEARYSDTDGTRNDRGAYGGPTLNTPPEAYFSLSASQGSLATIFVFDGGLSRDKESDDGELYFRWDWDGDGSYDTDFTEEEVATHQYGTLGTKTVNLQVRDKGGFTSVATKQLVILNQSPNTPHDPSPANESLSVPADVTLSWACEDPDPGDTVTYDVYLGVDSYLDLELISASQTATACTPGTLQHEKSHFWKIVATDSHGASVSSPVWSFSTELEPSPDSPSALEAEAVSTSQIDLTWTDNSDNELGFKIERKIGALGSYIQLGTVMADVTSFSDTGLIGGVSYYYRVCAYNTGGSAYSNEASAAPWIQPVASFALSPDRSLIGQIGQTIAFDASPSSDQDGYIVSYEWDFGDENSDFGEVVEHVYSDAGDYTVTLTVVDEDGVTDTVSEIITIVEVGDANADGEVDVGDITEVVRITIGLDDIAPGADAKQDGMVNALDMTKIEELMTGMVGVHDLPLAGGNGVTVSIDVPAEVAEGTSFLTGVTIDGAINFDACNYDVSYDNSVLEVTDVSDGDVNGTIIPVLMWSEITLGTIRVVQNVPETAGVSGSGYLADIHFQIIGSAGSTSTTDLHEGVLGNTSAQEISTTWVDGLVHVVEAPTISFNPSSLTFAATEGGANPPSQTLSIWNSGGGMLTWSVSDDADWLTLDPLSDSSTGETDDVTVSVNITGMSAGSYPATITISASGATNSPQTVPVNLNIDYVPPRWDVNGDGRVNVLDMILVGQHYGETGPPGWIAEDVNCDGVIDDLDMILIAEHWTG